MKNTQLKYNSTNSKLSIRSQHYKSAAFMFLLQVQQISVVDLLSQLGQFIPINGALSC